MVWVGCSYIIMWRFILNMSSNLQRRQYHMNIYPWASAFLFPCLNMKISTCPWKFSLAFLSAKACSPWKIVNKVSSGRHKVWSSQIFSSQSHMHENPWIMEVTTQRWAFIIKTSWHGSTFHIIVPLLGVIAGHWWILLTKGKWCQSLKFPFLIWTSCLANSRLAGDLRCHDTGVTTLSW